MRGIARTYLVGTVEADPEEWETREGTLRAVFSVCTVTGRKQTRAVHRCVAFGEMARAALETLYVGAVVFVEGQPDPARAGGGGSDIVLREFALLDVTGGEDADVGARPPRARPASPSAAPGSRGTGTPPATGRPQ